MSERIYTPTQAEVKSTVDRFYKTPAEVVQIFSLHHQHRQVFRVREPNGDDAVLKVRKDDEAGNRETWLINQLIRSYRFSGAKFPSVYGLTYEGRIAMRMPYLGPNLQEIAQDLDAASVEHFETPPDVSVGFTPSQIDMLAERLRKDHINFAQKSGLIHGDIIQPHNNPTNVVYNEDQRVLFLVDGEALAPVDDEREDRFHTQLDSLREWMYLNLEASVPAAVIR